MENIKLIIDSSSNMKSDPDHNVEVVPLTISFGGKDYIDDQNLNCKRDKNCSVWHAKFLLHAIILEEVYNAQISY